MSTDPTAQAATDADQKPSDQKPKVELCLENFLNATHPMLVAAVQRRIDEQDQPGTTLARFNS